MTIRIYKQDENIRFPIHCHDIGNTDIVTDYFHDIIDAKSGIIPVITQEAFYIHKDNGGFIVSPF